jgi:phosphoribosylamine--glycine ligase
MGAYAPAPLISVSLLDKIKNKIIEPTIKGMKNEGSPFVGCLYAGLMISNGEPSVIEFNVRFGDPEAQAVLPIIEGDFTQLLYSAATGQLDANLIKNVTNRYACCVVLASDGYPGQYPKGFEISGIEDAEKLGAIVYHAGTAMKGNQIVNSGGRVLSITGLGDNLKEAIDNAYRAVDVIHFENKYFRQDIGFKGLRK